MRGQHFCPFCYISDHKVCFRQYVRRVSHISLVNSQYGLSTSQIRVRVLARRFELGDARPNCGQLISFSPHDHDMITTAIYHCSQNLTGANYIFSRIFKQNLSESLGFAL